MDVEPEVNIKQEVHVDLEVDSGARRGGGSRARSVGGSGSRGRVGSRLQRWMWRWNVEREVGGGVEREVERGVDVDAVDAVEVEREVDADIN